MVCWWPNGPIAPWCHLQRVVQWYTAHQTPASWQFLFPFWIPPKEPSRGRHWLLRESFLIQTLPFKHFSQISVPTSGQQSQINLFSLVALIYFLLQKLIWFGPPFKAWVQQSIIPQTRLLSHPGEKAVFRRVPQMSLRFLTTPRLELNQDSERTITDPLVDRSATGTLWNAAIPFNG